MKIRRRVIWLSVWCVIYFIAGLMLPTDKFVIVHFVWLIMMGSPLYIKPLGRYIFKD